MARYIIHFLAAHGEIETSQILERLRGDDVIDFVGESEHHHAINILDGARRVARFAPWRR